MRFLDIIAKKRDGRKLSKEELEFFANGTVTGEIPDYQISAMLMAIYFQGLDYEETTHLTLAMANSGKILDLSHIDKVIVDKHSTGGVADTASLILVPLVAAAGVPVFKMSGKGLGYSGGTIDKLMSIPGINVDMDIKDAIKLCKEIGAVIVQQTKDLAPADKKLYALRDVTGTVESIPLIAGSIISKKLAGGANAIVLDVKCGSGAFMKNEADARLLAETMVNIGKISGRDIKAVITDMNQPLGKYIGNSLEVIEAAEVLKGNVKGDLLEVSLTLGAHMLVMAGKAKDTKEGRSVLLEKVENGEGLLKFKEIIKLSGGNPDVLDDTSLLPISELKGYVKASKSGFIGLMDTEKIGSSFVLLGGGRLKSDDEIDYGAGIIMKVRIGDKVEAGDILAEIYTKKDDAVEEVIENLNSAIEITDEKVEIPALIKYVVE